MVSFFGSSITIFNYLQIRKQSGVSDFQYTDSETGTEAIQGLSRQDEIHETMYHEAPGRLVPIATLDTLPSLKESKTLVNNRIFQKNFRYYVLLYHEIIERRSNVNYYFYF